MRVWALIGLLLLLVGCSAFGELQERTARAMNPGAFAEYDRQEKRAK